MRSGKGCSWKIRSPSNCKARLSPMIVITLMFGLAGPSWTCPDLDTARRAAQRFVGPTPTDEGDSQASRGPTRIAWTGTSFKDLFEDA